MRCCVLSWHAGWHSVRCIGMQDACFSRWFPLRAVGCVLCGCQACLLPPVLQSCFYLSVYALPVPAGVSSAALGFSHVRVLLLSPSLLG